MRISAKGIGVAILVLCAATFAGVSLAIWAFNHLNVGIPLNGQKLSIQLDDAIDADVKLDHPLDVQVEGRVNSVIPIRETLNIPLTQTLNPHVYIDSHVPIKTTIPVKQMLEVEQILPVDTRVNVKVLGKNVNLPLKGDIPIKIEVPLDLSVPLDQTVHLKFDTDVKTVLKENLKIPIQQDIKANIPVKGRLNVPLKEAMQAEVKIHNQLPVTVAEGRLDIPLNKIKIQQNSSQTAVPATTSIP